MAVYNLKNQIKDARDKLLSQFRSQTERMKHERVKQGHGFAYYDRSKASFFKFVLNLLYSIKLNLIQANSIFIPSFLIR